MYRTTWKIMALAFVCTLVLVPRGRAQQDPSPRPHPPGILMAADKHDDDEDEDEEHEHGRRGHEGRMGHEGMSIQQHLERLTQQLKLTDEQRAKVRPILYNHAKEMIRLQAELATLRLDVPPLLEAEPVDLAKVKQQFLAMATKEADLHLAHVTAMQEIRKVLTPEQQQQFKTLQGRMMHEGETRASGQAGASRTGLSRRTDGDTGEEPTKDRLPRLMGRRLAVRFTPTAAFGVRPSSTLVTKMSAPLGVP